MLKYIVLTFMAIFGLFFGASWLLVFAAPHLYVSLNHLNPWTAFWPVWWQNHYQSEWHISALLWLAGGTAVILTGLTLAAAITLINLTQGKNRQPDLYGTSEMAGPQKMAMGGITTEKRR